MPHKGFFTQGAMVLTERPLADEAVERALSSFEVVSRAPAEGEKSIEMPWLPDSASLWPSCSTAASTADLTPSQAS